MYRRGNATPAAEKVCRRTRVGNGIARAGDCSLPSASRTLWLKCDGSSQASRGKVAVDGGRDCEANGRSPATVAALSHRIEEPRHRKGQGTGLVSPGANSKGPSPPPRAPGERVARFATHQAAADEGPESAACAIWFRRPGPVVRIDSASLEKPPLSYALPARQLSREQDVEERRAQFA
jgi:hypothetical protein